MPSSYTLALLQHGSVYTVERREFSKVLLVPGTYTFPDGSISSDDALLHVNRWNQKAVQEARNANLPVRFVYYL